MKLNRNAAKERRFFMKYKLALLLTLTMMMPTATTVFAAETSTETAAESTSEEGAVSTEESGVWQLTFEEALELAELNYSLGRNTALDVTKAELDVEEAENTLAQIVYSHDMKVYQLENTELL